MLYHVGLFSAVLLAYWIPGFFLRRKYPDRLPWQAELISQLAFLLCVLFAGFLLWSFSPGDFLRDLRYALDDFFLMVAPTAGLVLSAICYAVDGLLFCSRLDEEARQRQVKRLWLSCYCFLPLPLFFAVNLWP